MKSSLSVLAIVLLVFLASCAPEQSESISPIRIGLSAPLTGNVADLGQRFVDGATIAAQEATAAGTPIELVIEDDGCNAKRGADVANSLVTLQGLDVVAVYCGAASPGFVAAMTGKDGILFVESIRLEIAEGKDPFVFNMLPSPEAEMQVLAEHILSQNLTEVAVLYQQDYFGETYKNKFIKAFEALGGDVVVVEGFDTNAPKDFRTFLTKSEDEQVDAIVNFMAHPPNYDPLLRQAEELGVKTRFFSEWIAENPTLLTVAGSRADGIVYTHPFGGEETPAFVALREKYRTEYGKEVNLDTVNGYDTVRLIVELSKECGEDASCMVRALQSGTSYEGVSGPISFKDGMGQGAVYLKTIEGGAFVRVE